LAVGDLNGDKKPDVCATRSGDGSIALFLNTGSGIDMPTMLPTGTTTASSASVADLDGDGKIDLVFLGATGIVVMLGKGDGTFAAPVTLTASAGSMTVADLNGDNKADLITTSGLNGYLGIFPNSGSGAFSASLSVPGALGRNVFVTSGDVNGDGKIDLLVSGAAVGVIANNGSLMFGPTLNYSSNGPRQIGLADFDGDGSLDMAVVSGIDNNVGVFLNTSR
jgi:hypothetical protein